MTDLPPPPAGLLDGAALLLDFDGTLVELVDRPEQVRVDAALASLIARLVDRLHGRVALISGRPAAALADMIATPGLLIAGSHGLELRHGDGTIDRADRPAALDVITAEMRGFAAGDDRLIVEDKPLGVALHYRPAPEREDAARALATRLAETHALRLQPGKMMIEVRHPGADKGTALAAIMTDPAMAGARPVFVGDDDTDEPAHAAAAVLRGAGVLVGEQRATAAGYRLADVAAVRAWLASAAA